MLTITRPIAEAYEGLTKAMTATELSKALKLDRTQATNRLMKLKAVGMVHSRQDRRAGRNQHVYIKIDRKYEVGTLIGKQLKKAPIPDYAACDMLCFMAVNHG